MTRTRNERRWAAPSLTLVVLIAIQSCGWGQSSKSGNDGQLAASVTSFLEEWLVKRDVTAAMQHVSNSPILGKCNTPPDLANKKTLAPEDYRAGVKMVLAAGLEHAMSGNSLGSVIQPAKGVPPGEKLIAVGQPFDLFSLHSAKKSRFICKFDSSTSFRKRFEDAETWYATWTMTSERTPGLKWIAAWKQEKGQWRLLSIALLED